MATTAFITQELMDEIGKSSGDVRQRIEQAVGEVVVDILLASDARFRKLQRDHTVTLIVNKTSYPLPAEFYRLQETFIEVNSDGELVREWTMVDQPEFYRRLADSEYSGQYYSTIETKTNPPGDYLLLCEKPTATGYLKLFYWREPKATDTDIITNTAAIKEGVRSKLAQYWPDAATHTVIYERMKEGIADIPDQVTTGMVWRPPAPRQRLNRLERKIGRGR